MTDDDASIIVAGDDGEVLGEQEGQQCRNGTPNYAGPNAYDLTCELPVSICAACRRETTGRCPSCGR